MDRQMPTWINEPMALRISGLDVLKSIVGENARSLMILWAKADHYASTHSSDFEAAIIRDELQQSLHDLGVFVAYSPEDECYTYLF